MSPLIYLPACIYQEASFYKHPSIIAMITQTVNKRTAPEGKILIEVRSQYPKALEGDLLIGRPLRGNLSVRISLLLIQPNSQHGKQQLRMDRLAQIIVRA
jgi:hypothetical protein